MPPATEAVTKVDEELTRTFLLEQFPEVYLASTGELKVTEVLLGAKKRKIQISPHSLEKGVSIDLSTTTGDLVDLDPLFCGHIEVTRSEREQAPTIITSELDGMSKEQVEALLSLLGQRLSLARQINELEQSLLLYSTVNLLEGIE